MRGRFGDAIVRRDHARHLLPPMLHVLGEGVTRGLDDLEQGEVDVAQPAADCWAQSRTTPTSSRSSNWPPLATSMGATKRISSMELSHCSAANVIWENSDRFDLICNPGNASAAPAYGTPIR